MAALTIDPASYGWLSYFSAGSVLFIAYVGSMRHKNGPE